jgi:hypothetical protein
MATRDAEELLNSLYELLDLEPARTGAPAIGKAATIALRISALMEVAAAAMAYHQARLAMIDSRGRICPATPEQFDRLCQMTSALDAALTALAMHQAAAGPRPKPE